MTIDEQKKQADILVAAGASLLAFKQVAGLAEQWRPEEALYRDELQFRHLLDNLPAGVYTCDTSGLITYFNSHATRLWGRTPKLNHAADRFCGSFRLFSGEGSPVQHDQCWMALALLTNKEYAGEEIIFEQPDGTRLTVLAHASPIRNKSGTLLGAINILVDITDRKRSEELLKQADRQKDHFLAVLAHELRNPLAPIRSALHILYSENADKTMRMAARDIMTRQVNLMVQLVDDLMDVSSIRGGKVKLHKERLRLRDIIQSAVEVSQPLIDKQKHILDVEMAPDFIYVDGDMLRLSQVFANLLNNAAKYSEPGSHIHVQLEQDGTQGIVRIRDNGIGISAEIMPYIFDMYSQADNSLDRTQGGLGIGLMLVKNLVEMHGGSVEAHSEGLNKGCEFTVRLPASKAAGNATSTQMQHTEQSLVPMRILVVEDYEPLAKMTAWMLELEGHEIWIAKDGPTAIEMAKTHLPDLVLMDIGIPGMSGYEACAIMRKEPALSHTIFAAQTGWGQPEHYAMSKEAGFDLHLVKPIDMAKLRHALSTLDKSSRPQPATAAL